MKRVVDIIPVSEKKYFIRSKATKEKYAKDGKRRTERGDTQARVLGRQEI